MSNQNSDDDRITIGWLARRYFTGLVITLAIFAGLLVLALIFDRGNEPSPLEPTEQINNGR